MKKLPLLAADSFKDQFRHVLYEHQMMFDPIFYITSGHATNDRTMFNAILESGLVHARNLIYFFSGEKKWNTDIHVSDIDSALPGLSERLYPLFKGHPEKERIHWQICHLTRYRSDNVSEKEWSRPMILQPFLPVVCRFLDEALNSGILVTGGSDMNTCRRIRALADPGQPDWSNNLIWFVATSSMDSASVTTYVKD